MYVVDSSTVHSTISALTRRDGLPWTGWERTALSELTIGLLYRTDVRIPKPPNGGGHTGGENLSDVIFNTLSDSISEQSFTPTIGSRALVSTKQWVNSDLDRIREAYKQFKLDPSSEVWTRWAVERDWPYHVLRLNSLVDESTISEVAAVLNWSEEEQADVRVMGGNLELVRWWSRRLRDDGELPPQQYIDGYRVAGLIRGRYYYEVAKSVNGKNIWHPSRNYILDSVNSTTSFAGLGDRKVQAFLAGIICVSALEESSEMEAVKSWAENIRNIRSRVLDIAPETDNTIAGETAARLARDCELRLVWSKLDKILQLAENCFVIPLVGIATGTIARSLGAPNEVAALAGGSAGFLSRPFADRLRLEIYDGIIGSDPVLKRMARTGVQRLFAVTEGDLKAL